MNKESLGLYLSHTNNQQKCRQYIQMLGLGGLSVDEALRKFFVKINLPGEAQKIDRYIY